MTQEPRRSDVGVLVGAALVALGVWLLMDRVFGRWFYPLQQAIDLLRRVGWPIAIIAIGVLVLLASQRGDLAERVHGKRLMRSRGDRVVSGVLGGLGVYLGIDPTWLRVGYVLLALALGLWPAILIYLAGAIIIPEEPKAPPVAPTWPGRETASPGSPGESGQQ